MIKKIIGVILIILGLLALVTPLTPGSWLVFIGLELLGFKFLLNNKFISKIKEKIMPKKNFGFTNQSLEAVAETIEETIK